MVYVVQLDHVIGCQRPPVAPGPTDRDAGVIEVVNEVVREVIPSRLPDPNADRAGEQFAAVMDVAAADFVGAGLFGVLVAHAGFAKLHAARAEVREFTPDDTIALAAARQFQAVVAKV